MVRETLEEGGPDVVRSTVGVTYQGCRETLGIGGQELSKACRVEYHGQEGGERRSW